MKILKLEENINDMMKEITNKDAQINRLKQVITYQYEKILKVESTAEANEFSLKEQLRFRMLMISIIIYT